jgi:hypothetical protein
MLGLVQPPADGVLPAVQEPLWSRLGRGQILGWAAVGIADAIALDFTVPPRPTVLDLMGAPTPATFMGESLTPTGRGTRRRSCAERLERYTKSPSGA